MAPYSAHTPRPCTAAAALYVDDIYQARPVVHISMQTAHGLQWAGLMGVVMMANLFMFVTPMACAKPFEAH